MIHTLQANTHRNGTAHDLGQMIQERKADILLLSEECRNSLTLPFSKTFPVSTNLIENSKIESPLKASSFS